MRIRANGWWAVLLVALAATVAQAFGRFTYSVLLPAVRDDLGLSNAAAGLLGTINVGAYLLGTLAVVRATATVRLLTLMRTGLALSITGLATASFAPSAPVLAAGLVATGLGGACIWIPSPALASSSVAEERRGLAVGMIGAGIGLGIVSAGQLANVLRERLGDTAWQDVYRIEAVVGIVVAAGILLLLRPAVDPQPARAGSGLSVLRRMEGWLPLTAAYTAFGFSYLLALTYLTARLEDDAGFTESGAAAVFAASGLAAVVGGVVLGALADRFGPRQVLIGGFAGMALAAAGILSGGVPLVYAGAMLSGLVQSGIPLVIAAYILAMSTPEEYGSRYAVATLAFGTAQVAAPQVGGLLADATGAFTMVFVLSGVVALLGGAAAWALPRVRDRRASASPGIENPWLSGGSDGEDYADRLREAVAAAEAEGRSPHGEADLVTALGPRSVLDAGCGTGRVGIELAARGVDVVGVDLDPSMLAVARREAPDVPWVEHDLAGLAMDRAFDVVVAAGNVMIFLTPGTLDAVVASLAGHLHPGGHLVAGWHLPGGPSGQPLDLATYDAACGTAGLSLVDRLATWEGEPYAGGEYAVSIHRLAPAG